MNEDIGRIRSTAPLFQKAVKEGLVPSGQSGHIVAGSGDPLSLAGPIWVALCDFDRPLCPQGRILVDGALLHDALCQDYALRDPVGDERRESRRLGLDERQGKPLIGGGKEQHIQR